MYRENPGMWRYYPATESAQRGLKLDDTFYLTASSEVPPLYIPPVDTQVRGDGFAEALLREGDYYRAITEYKRRMFLYPQDSTYCLMQIARAYCRSAKYQSAVEYASLALERPDLSAQQRSDANLTVGLCYMGLHLPILSWQYFNAAGTLDTVGVNALCMGWLLATEGKWKVAHAVFQQVARAHVGDTLGSSALKLSTLASQGPYLPHKSPAIAVALSTVLPGAGQMYGGHGYDALQAFLMTSSFAFASYGVYRYEREPGRHLRYTYLAVGITSLFHAANILSAQRTASYYNWRQRNDHLIRIQELILPHIF